MSQKSSLPQAANSVSQVLMSDTRIDTRTLVRQSDDGRAILIRCFSPYSGSAVKPLSPRDRSL